MKNKSILSLLVALLAFGSLSTSCEDMLTPDMNRYAEQFSGRDTVYFYYGILRNVQDMVEQNKLVNDLRGDLADTTSYSSDSVANLINFVREDDGENGLLSRAAYYKVINQCNFYLAAADTMAKKNNIYYMRREFAQVTAIRAWTYLQLVQTYGKVPFITDPVDNANTGWETNPPLGFATADNLVDLLKKDLEQSSLYEQRYGYPEYPSISTGSGLSINHKNMCFYSDLILGDLYLLRGQSKSDYVEAAKCYYKYLEDNAATKYIPSPSDDHLGHGSSAAYFMESKSNLGVSYIPVVDGWKNAFLENVINANEHITLIPGAANSTFGRVLTQSVQIYGFDPRSSNSTSSDVNGENVSTSGQVNLSVNYKSRQVGPSAGYLQLAAAQNYIESNTKTNPYTVEYYEGAGDARVWGTAPFVRTTDGTERYITKSVIGSSSGQYARYFEYRYLFTLYRTRQVYLRYAEALNRAGYPRHAFAVLRNGMNFDKMPSVADSIDTVRAMRVYYVDSCDAKNNGANYIGADEIRRAQADGNYGFYLNFNNTKWKNGGIHELGCGTSSDLDTLYSYNVVVAQRMKDEAIRSGQLTDAVKGQIQNLITKGQTVLPSETGTAKVYDKSTEEDSIEVTYYKPVEPTEEEINAVETLIADECALETAFEGYRMPDLIRFARHKNNGNGADYGTQWLAWKIARRALRIAPYAQPDNVGNSSLYQRLLIQDNWYLKNPQY